jgi:hypothetical protein
MQRVRSFLTAFFVGVTVAAGTAVVGISPAQAAGETAVIGMPMNGKWAYNVNVNPPWTDINSSHPSVHSSPGTQWATDLYASAGTDVRFYAKSSGALSYSWASSTTSCGQSTMINVHVNGVNVGRVYFAHLTNAVKSGPITNGMVVGKMAVIKIADRICNPGPHFHIGFSNTTNQSCFVSYGNPGTSVSATVPIGVLGSSNTRAKQECSSLPGTGQGGGSQQLSGMWHAYYGMANGQIRETYNGGGATLTTGPELKAFTSPVTAVTYQLHNGIQHVFTGLANGQIFETYWGNGHTLTTGAPIANVGSAVTSLSSQITPDVTFHVYSGNTAGQVRETYFGGGHSLTTGAPLFTFGSPVTDIASKYTGNGVQHVYTAVTSGIYETYWGGGNSLTTYRLDGGNIKSKVNKISVEISLDGVQHVYSGTANGQVYETYWGGSQNHARTTYVIYTAPTAVTALTSFLTYENDQLVQHVFAGTAGGKLTETYWGGIHTRTTGQLGNAGTSKLNAITARLTPNGVMHVFSASTNGLVYETYWGGGNTLTTSAFFNAGSPVQAIDSIVT